MQEQHRREAELRRQRIEQARVEREQYNEMKRQQRLQQQREQEALQAAMAAAAAAHEQERSSPSRAALRAAEYRHELDEQIEMQRRSKQADVWNYFIECS